MGASYGGDSFSWVGAVYKVKVSLGLAPLTWLEGITRHILSLKYMILTKDGGLQRPGDGEPLFPIRGIDLKWRWDEVRKCVFIHFWQDGALLTWRWDELFASEQPGSSGGATPNFSCVGHFGKKTYEYALQASGDL